MLYVQVDRPDKLIDIVGQSRLADKVSGILDRLERELDDADATIGNAMHVLDLDGDGLVSFLRDIHHPAVFLTLSILGPTKVNCVASPPMLRSVM